MCRSIRTLHNFEPPATDEEVHAAALQYVRKISGSRDPSRANTEAFEAAVRRSPPPPALVDSLVTPLHPRTGRWRRPRRASGQQTGIADVVRVATWNVNSLTARLDRVLAFLDESVRTCCCSRRRRSLLRRSLTSRSRLPGMSAATIREGGGRVWRSSPGRPRHLRPRSGLAGEPDGGQARWVEATVDGTTLRQRVRAERPGSGHRDVRREAPLPRGMAVRAGPVRAEADHRW
jgi:hypothetical protein